MPGTECHDFDNETCDDGVISFCYWGRKTTMDCKRYGLSGCTTMPFGTQTTAKCTP